MLGHGIQIQKRKGLYNTVDPVAQGYYDYLNTVNGGQVDYNSLYSVSNDQALSNFDTHFSSIRAFGYLNELNHYFPYFGGTAATHSVCAIDLAQELLFVNSPVHSANGVTLNGTTQYIDPQNTPSNDADQDSAHLMELFIGSGTHGFGCRDTSPSMWGSATATNKICDLNSAANRINVSNSATNNPFIISRTTDSRVDLYYDGTSIGNDTTFTAVALPTNYSTTFGARNLEGTIGLYANGDIRSSSIGTGLTAAQASHFNSQIKALQTAFGR